MQTSVKRLFDVPYYQLAESPLKVALAGKENGQWKTYSTEEYIHNANLISKGLLLLGVQSGDKIAVVSNNRPEWNFLDIGVLQLGAANVPIYPTSSEEDFEYILNDCGAKIIVASDADLFAKIMRVKDKTPLEHVFTFDQVEGAKHYSEILKLGEDGNQDQVEHLKEQVKEDDLATLIYTSGTTGRPKGVMLSHKNIASNSIASATRFPVSPGAVSLSFLPLCHIYERMIIYMYQYRSVQVWYAESLETIGDDLKDVKPHVFTAVPRLLEKVYDKIMAKGLALSGIKKKLFFWAVELAETYEPYGANGSWYEFKLKIARKLIFSKWKEGVGGRVGIVASGSAALQPRLARIYLAAEINVMEGYGLTETSPVISVNEMENQGVRIGTVGRPIPGVEVKIAEDGEILVKGPNVMQGYYNKPEKTAEVLTEDRWFHTGDIGELSADGFLKITDRKKEIFKTSGGKYIAPQVMENKFKESKFIENIVVIGENQKHAAALVFPNMEFLQDWCKEKGIPFHPTDTLTNEKVIDRFQKEIDKYNEPFGQWEKLKKFRLIETPLTIENGELTPTLKLKRKIIHKNYKAQIDDMYC